MWRILMALKVALCESSSPVSVQRPKSSTGMLLIFCKQDGDHDGAVATLGLQALENMKVCKIEHEMGNTGIDHSMRCRWASY